MPDKSQSLRPDQAAKLLNADLANLVKKVTGGRPLSAGERTLLQAVAETNGKTSTKRFAKNLVELAKELGLSRKTIQRWRDEPWFPKARSDGRWNIAECRQAALTNGKLEEDDGTKLSQTQLKAKQILLQNEKLEYQIGVLKGQYIPAAEVEKWGAHLGSEIRKAVNSIHTIAPSIVGQTIADAEMRLREMEDEILTILNLLTDTNAFPSAPVEETPSDSGNEKAPELPPAQ